MKLKTLKLFKLLLFGSLLLWGALSLSAQTLTGTEEEILIWNGPGPGSDTLSISQTVVERTPGGDCTIDRAVSKVTETGIIPFIASEPNGTAVLICPGGAYSYVVIDKEGTDIAEWFNALGISAFVVKYRLPINQHIDKQLVTLQDAQRAIRYVRNNAEHWGIDSSKIGIMGASAGGHMAAMLATSFNDSTYTAMDSIDSVNARPDFMILIYPVVSMETGITHSGTRTNLLGSSPTQEMIDKFSAEKHVTPETPITFMARAQDDTSVPEMNCTGLGGALAAAGVSYELHQYMNGGHGNGICKSVGTDFHNWINECGNWLYANGLSDSMFVATSVSDRYEKGSISVYPNPVASASGIIIRLPDTESVTINLYDIAGRLLNQKNMNNVKAGDYSFGFNIPEIKGGYIVAEITCAEGNVSRLIKLK